ncbi:MAG: amidohydrolase family protein [Armatimonadota bacterium]|nr:amidohydrolase family protein [Armatimonadota bacterium]
MASTESLRETILSLPIVDTHTHLRASTDFAHPVTAYTLLNSSGCLRALWVVSGALTRQEYRQFKSLDDWESLSPAIDCVKNTAFYRILLSGLRELYKIDFDEVDAVSLDDLGQSISRAYRDRGWYGKVLKDKSGLDVICQDSRQQFDRKLFTPVARMDDYVLFGRAGWDGRVLERHGADRTSSLDGLVCCLEEDFSAAMSDGAAAIKSNLCWGRTLSFEPVGEAAANDAFAICRSSECDGRREKLLGDFVMERIARLCAEHNVPLQIHTGPAGGVDHVVGYGNPLNLNNLILRNPETSFVLFHAGGPFVRESAALATQFPNVYLDLCGVLGNQYLKRILDDWIEMVPLNKLMWGTDVNTVEESYAMVRNFRKVLSELLVERVRSGYFSLATAEEWARAITAGNAKRVLRLPASR